MYNVFFVQRQHVEQDVPVFDPSLLARFHEEMRASLCLFLRRFVHSKFLLKCQSERFGCKLLVEQDVQHMPCDILM